MNLAVLKKSPHRPQVGDIFVLRPPDGKFLYGRVVATDARIGPMEGCILIYIYRTRSTVKEAIPQLRPSELLLAPMFTNRLPWSRGYFEHVRSDRLDPEDRLPQHCFRSFSGDYFDEYGNRVPVPCEPTGVRGLASFRVIDDEVSGALGIPLAPEDDEVH